MNQILVTKKLYITPELKRKKKIYKFYFFLSVFLVFALISVYIYAEVDRNKSEEASQAILDEFNQGVEDTTLADGDVLIAVLNDTSEEDGSSSGSSVSNEPQKTIGKTKIQSTNNGFNYSTIATINIPKIKGPKPTPISIKPKKVEVVIPKRWASELRMAIACPKGENEP